MLPYREMSELRKGSPSFYSEDEFKGDCCLVGENASNCWEIKSHSYALILASAIAEKNPWNCKFSLSLFFFLSPQTKYLMLRLANIGLDDVSELNVEYVLDL